MQKSKGFNLIEMIIIMVITSIISIIATGVIMLKSNNNKLNYVNTDTNLQEFLEVYNTIISKYYDKIDKKGLLNAAEQGMINYLGDKYSTYLDDKEYQDILDELSATYEGIGIGIEGNKIVTITPSSPADRAGLKVGDYITKVDNVITDYQSGEWIKNYIRNNDEKNIRLEITRDGLAYEYTLSKEKLENTVVSFNVIEGTKIGYLYISKFSINLDTQVERALQELENNGINSLIVDVRDNVGGYLTAAEKTASLFLEEGKKIYSLQSSNSEVTYRDETKENRNYPIVVLINNNTASAAEILAAALRDSNNATLVGTKSYGKGKVQEVSGLDSGGSMKLTTAKWLTPNGVCIDGVGLSPDYNIDGSDNQLIKAVELLKGNI